jgi:arylformamidase
MRLIDLSQPIYDGCPNCPVHPPVRSQVTATHERDGWHMELLTATTHTGSHVDAPLHKLAGGANISQIPLDRFVGPSAIADLRDSEADRPLTAQLLKDRLPAHLEDRIVLLATGWGQRRAASDEWHYHSPYLTPDGARFLVDRKVRGVGIDSYTMGGSREPENSQTHATLLSAGVWIVEDLLFTPEAMAVPPDAVFWSLPVNFRDHSGAFCRPVLVVA